MCMPSGLRAALLSDRTDRRCRLLTTIELGRLKHAFAAQSPVHLRRMYEIDARRECAATCTASCICSTVAPVSTQERLAVAFRFEEAPPPPLEIGVFEQNAIPLRPEL